MHIHGCLYPKPTEAEASCQEVPYVCVWGGYKQEPGTFNPFLASSFAQLPPGGVERLKMIPG